MSKSEICLYISLIMLCGAVWLTIVQSVLLVIPLIISFVFLETSFYYDDVYIVKEPKCYSYSSYKEYLKNEAIKKNTGGGERT